ncbi:hypothetical protein [Erwinia aphidicola]|uniref:hypothetical protein n=1 Tax=Erwinia aphidicola TaxID=68334 RepID=UPI00301A9571
MVNANKMLLITLSFLCILSPQVKGRVVSQLEIKGVGLVEDGRNDKSEERECKSFKPTKIQMIAFFNLAKESEKNGTLLHEYYSPCLAIGTIKFQDGSSGRWTVKSSGLGFVIFENKKSAVFFHKENKWDDPYACTYGLGDDLIC